MPSNVSPFEQPQFEGDLAVLSNFDMTPFFVPSLNRQVKSNEHLFNMFKFEDPAYREHVLAAPTPGVAKSRGRSRKVPIRAGWDAGLRVRAMQTGLLAKFAVPELAAVLAATEDMLLIETNRHHDVFWGHCLGGGRTPCRPECSLPGKNMLGELLMALRCRSLADL